MAKVEVKLAGLSGRQSEIASAILASDAKYHTVNSGRQAGKTYLLSRLAMVAALTSPEENIMIVSPTYDQVGIIYEKIVDNESFKKFIKRSIGSKPYRIELVNGCSMFFKSADKADSIRGGTYKWVFMDEFAFFKKSVFQKAVIPTTMSVKKSKILAFSTPKGKSNDFYDLKVLSEKTPRNYQYYKMHYSDNPNYDLAEVDNARLTYPRQLFLQEFEGEYIDSGGEVFEGLDIVAKVNQWSNNGKQHFAGIDWGRASDKTSLTIVDDKGDVAFHKSIGGNWPEQIKIIAEILSQYNAITEAESNGIGDPLISALLEKNSSLTVIPFIMSNSSKEEIVTKMRMEILTEQFGLPTLDLASELHRQLSIYTFSQTKTGAISYHHPIGDNDDEVDSLMIARHCFRHYNQGFSIPTCG